MFTIPYIETEERFFYLDVFLKAEYHNGEIWVVS